VAGMPLRNLRMEHCPVADISALAGKSFTELSLFDTKVTDIGVLRTMPSLGTLWLRETQVTDLSPLSDVSLVSLDIQDTPVSDLLPLTGKQSLQRLNMAGTQVTDLRPLSGLQLTRLIFTPGRIENGIDIVREMKSLRELDVQFEDASKVLGPEEFWKKYDAGEFAAAADDKRD
jgi:Leucine-rich repeat (LRR) protein